MCLAGYIVPMDKDLRKEEEGLGRTLYALTFYKYFLFNTYLSCVKTVKNLGVLLDSKLSYIYHMEMVSSKPIDFTGMSSIKALYYEYIESTLKYAFVI